MPATFLPTFSLCVCTRDRPDDLRQVLASIEESTMPAHEVIVSDDSSNYATRQMMRDAFPEITYVEGPRRGCAANRNRALRAASGTHVLFMDDDCRLGATFLQQMSERIADDFIYRVAAGGNADGLIVTGTGQCAGQRVWPHKPSFLGHPSIAYRCGERLYTVLISSAVFPRGLLQRLQFDEQLTQDYDVIDLVSRAVLDCNCRIDLLPSAENSMAHLPAGRVPGPEADASRIYTMLHHYGWSQHQRAKAALFLTLALQQSLTRQLRVSGWRGTRAFIETLQLLKTHMRQHLDQPASYDNDTDGHGGNGMRAPLRRS
ncbi:putative glycosyltransferase [Cupriavidus necator]|uniref:glycosyltransferase family 2 protein n=1 Tax=Cupriavidus necator TaxID=106590 RepID=UPI003F73955C